MKAYFYRNKHYLIDIFVISVVLFAARYFYHSQFGLYEDDLTRIPHAISVSFAGVWDHIVFLMTHYYANRPMHEIFIYIFSWLGWQINGIDGVYVIGYLITLVNVVLFYFLLVKIHSRFLGLLGALAYALFSADTTQAYLTMSLGSQISNTLLLLAFHAYLFGPRWLAYLFIYPVILFAYETPFLVFMAAPLLDNVGNNNRFWKNLIAHGSIMGVMLLSSFIMRYAKGGDIDFEMGYRDAVSTALLHAWQGPLAAVYSYALRPYQVLTEMGPTPGFVSLISFIFFALYLNRVATTEELRPNLIFSSIQKRRFFIKDERIVVLLWLAGVGALMLLLAYPMTFTTQLTVFSGRVTRGHLAGVSGASLVAAVFAYMLLMVLDNFRQKKLAIVLLSGWFALLVGFGITLQQEYVRAWQLQKEFWTELLPLIQDASPGTAVLIRPEGLEDVSQIGANTWNLSRILNQLYIFPNESPSVPRVYRLLPEWENAIVMSDGSFQVNWETVTAPPDNYNTFSSNDIILISTEGGKMVRDDHPLIINGIPYSLKPKTASVLSLLPRAPLYNLLVDPSP